MVTRRNFLKTAALSSAGIAFGGGLDLDAASYSRVAGANGKVNFKNIQ